MKYEYSNSDWLLVVVAYHCSKICIIIVLTFKYNNATTASAATGNPFAALRIQQFPSQFLFQQSWDTSNHFSNDRGHRVKIRTVAQIYEFSQEGKK